MAARPRIITCQYTCKFEPRTPLKPNALWGIFKAAPAKHPHSHSHFFSIISIVCFCAKYQNHIMTRTAPTKSNKIKSLGRHYVFFSFFLCRRIPAVARKCQSPSGKHSKGLFTSVFGPTNGCNFALWVHYHAGDNVLVRWWRWLCWLTGPGIESWEKWTTWLAAWLPGEIIICLGQSQMGCTWPTCQRLSFGDGRLVGGGGL